MVVSVVVHPQELTAASFSAVDEDMQQNYSTTHGNATASSNGH